MSIEFWAVEDTNSVEHALHVKNLLNQGWQISSSHVTYVHHEAEYDRVQYTTFLQRDTSPKPQNGVYMASLMEVLEKRVAALESQYKELTAGDPLDEAVPTDWLEDQMAMLKAAQATGTQFIPVDNVYDEVIREALAEDAQAGVQ